MGNLFVYIAIIILIFGIVSLVTFLSDKLPVPQGKLTFFSTKDQTIRAEYYDYKDLWLFDKDNSEWVLPE